MQINVLVIVFILLVSYKLSAETYDLLVVCPDKCFPNIETPYVKVITDKSTVQILSKVLSESTSNKYLCGFDYTFNFYKKNSLKHSNEINIENSE